MKPWIEENLGDDYLWMQDGAPSHTSRRSQAWLGENFADFLRKEEWPPSSPDLNPMDFAIWGRLEGMVGKVHYPNVESLKEALERAWESLEEGELQRTVAKVQPKLHAVITSQGGHIEKI